MQGTSVRLGGQADVLIVTGKAEWSGMKIASQTERAKGKGQLS